MSKGRGKLPCLTCGTVSDASYCPAHHPYRGDWPARSRAQRQRTPHCECQGCPACTRGTDGCAGLDLCSDHVTNGGAELQTLCRACNSSKG